MSYFDAYGRPLVPAVQRQPQYVPPAGYVPHGTGLEPAPAPGPPASGDAWRRLWNRIPGSYASRSLAIFQLQRSGFRDPDVIVSRWAVNSEILDAAGAGNNQLTWVWDTLTIVNAIRAFVDPAGPADAFDYTINVRAGSDGGYVFGSDQNPASLTGVAAGDGTVLPIPMTPVSARPNNDWQGNLVGGAGIADTRIRLNFYGVSLWVPEGQIQ